MMPLMRRPARRIVVLLFVSAAVVLFGLRPAPARAYPPPGSVASITVSCATAQPGQQCTLTYCVEDAQGNPVSGQPVTFTSSNPSAAHPVPASGVTGATGCVMAIIAVGPGCGQVTIMASGAGLSAQTTINVVCPKNPLMFTGGAAPSAPDAPNRVPAVLEATLGGVGIVIAVVVLVAGRRRSRPPA
jgi:hypothetical protein